MKLIDLNRDGGIGANSSYYQIGDFHLVIDSGLHPKKAGRLAAPDLTPLKDVKLDLIIITHCHLDHIGSLPVLLRHHPNVPVILTAPSRMLIDRMLHNSVNVMVRERAEKGITEYPLYSHDEVDKMMPRLHALQFNVAKKFSGAKDDIEITLHPAGHVTGAAGVEIHHGHHRYFFTGDVLFDVQRTLAPAMFPKGRFDTLVMETTRGTTERTVGRSRSTEFIRLIEVINATLARGGSVLIPVFALGRMQEILAVLHDAKKFNRLTEAPIFASGLGLDICDYFDAIAKKTGQVHFTRTILKELKVRRTPRDLVAGKPLGLQGIYVVSSGMVVEHTASYTLAASLAGNAKNALCFVGYCDPETQGGRILAAEKGQDILFEGANFRTKLRAQVERFELSGHADREELLAYAEACNPKSIVLTHGDPAAREWFAEQIKQKLPHAKLTNPIPLQTYTV